MIAENKSLIRAAKLTELCCLHHAVGKKPGSNFSGTKPVTEVKIRNLGGYELEK